MKVLYYYTDAPVTIWREAIQAVNPDVELIDWPDWPQHRDAGIAMVWRPPAGELDKFPGLHTVFSLGAGVDHLLDNQALPADIQIVRMVDHALTAAMSEYVVMHTLFLHRHMYRYLGQQKEQKWQELPQTAPWNRRVGLMGTGVLGRDAIGKLTPFEFSISGWSRSIKNISGVKCYAGPDSLPEFLGNLDILILLLPATAATAGIINRETIAMLPPGAALINAGRGALVNEGDLLAALDDGRLSHVVLDVFQTEPLPPGHPFWAHPAVTITPHVASVTTADTFAQEFCHQIEKIRSGEKPDNVVDREAGY